MSVSLDEDRLGGLRWIVLRGPDHEAFRALGEHVRTEIAALTRDWPLLARLRAHVAHPAGRDRLAAVRQASAAAFPPDLGRIGRDSGPLLWHTNHGRYLPGAEASPGGNSVARGEILGARPVPQEDPGPAWFLDVLASRALPDGVRCDPSPGHSATTLCTFVADLTSGEAVLVNRGDQPVAIPLRDLAEGHPHAQRPVEGSFE